MGKRQYLPGDHTAEARSPCSAVVLEAACGGPFDQTIIGSDFTGLDAGYALGIRS